MGFLILILILILIFDCFGIWILEWTCLLRGIGGSEWIGLGTVRVVFGYLRVSWTCLVRTPVLCVWINWAIYLIVICIELRVVIIGCCIVRAFWEDSAPLVWGLLVYLGYFIV